MTTDTQTTPLNASVRAAYLKRLPPPIERRAIRERAGVSLTDMARELGVSHTAVHRWEHADDSQRRGFSHRTLGPYVELLEHLASLAPADTVLSAKAG